jgi:predicted amidophosphoribosyltransferase
MALSDKMRRGNIRLSRTGLCVHCGQALTSKDVLCDRCFDKLMELIRDKAMRADIFNSSEGKEAQIAKMQELFEEAIVEMGIRI